MLPWRSDCDVSQAMIERATFALQEADAPRLRAVVSRLASLRYSEHSIKDRLGVADLSDLQWRASPIYRSERLAGRDPLASAIDLFLLQGAVPANELNRLFDPSDLDILKRAGLLEIDDHGTARARASLFPVDRCLIFSDHAWPGLPHPGYPDTPCDQVMSVGRDSRNLAHGIPRRPFHSVFDLCTGSGIHAVLASKHAEHVLAIDVNPRAAQCTRFNAQISAIPNLEVMVGDLFEAVRSERFNLITANPPFVPSPLDTLRFRDGGSSGEDVQKRIIAGLPAHLAPDGFAQVVTELGEREHEPLVHRLREWLNGAPMDIYILRLGEYTALKYAIGHAKGNDYQAFLDSTQEWSSNLQAHGYVRMVSVIISFQWSDSSCGPPWTRVDESPPPHSTAGAQIDAAFLAERLTRSFDWQHALNYHSIHLAGPIAILEAHVLGRDLRARAKATLLGKALTIEHQLDPVERVLLDQVGEKGRIPAPDLLGISNQFDFGLPAVLAATRSLLRRQLVCIGN